MFADNFTKLAKNNTNFRKVLYTGPNAQVVAMSLPSGTDIGEETHPDTDQIFILVDGDGEAKVGDEVRPVVEKDLVFVPAGKVHNITNTGHEDMKLLTFYAPPEHPDGVVQATKESKEEIAKEQPVWAAG